MCSTGLAVIPESELWAWRNINTKAMLKTIEKNRDIIKGVKLRATGSVLENLGVEAVKVAKRVAIEAGLPLMIHTGIDIGETVPEDIMHTFTIEMLSLLDKGDILNHIYTSKVGGVFTINGTILPGFEEARQRGVVLDVAPAMSNFNFEVARKGLEQGVLPTTISTDITSTNINGPVFSLLSVMSRFLTLGLTLDQVIEMTTINPARSLGEEQRRGSLRIGMPADISLMELIEGDFSFSDGVAGNTLKGNLLLVPKLTLKSGVEIAAQPRFK
jgi:dihydroorotase